MMKRIVLISLLLTVVLITGIMPQSVYGERLDGSDYLRTSDEIQFDKDIYWRFEVIDFMYKLYYNFSSSKKYSEYKSGAFHRDHGIRATNDLEIWRTYKALFNFETYTDVKSCSINSAPIIYRDIQTEWNTNICPRFEKLRLIIERDFVPGITEEGWLALGDKIEPELDYLSQLMDNVVTKYNKRMNKLLGERKAKGIKPQEIEKEVKKEVKKELSKDDAKKSDDDSDDLFDMDCFIATAAYGTPMAAEIVTLRQFRNEFLIHNYSGRVFVEVYYATSPPIAGFISEHEVLRFAVRECFVDPIVAVVELTESWWAE